MGLKQTILTGGNGTIGISAVVPEEHPHFSIFVSVAAIGPDKDYILPIGFGFGVRLGSVL